MGQIINPDGSGKERQRLSRAVVLALRELMKKGAPDDDTRDLVAFISISLKKIFGTVEVSVVAWEKKGYWVKADHFRLEWEWSERLGGKMKQALLDDDWASIALMSTQVAQKFMQVKLPIRHGLGTPWIGAWKQIREQ